MPNPVLAAERWPALPLAEWRDTYATLHMWTQIVGKTRLALAPPENHWWHVTLHVSSCGLTTTPMPCSGCSLEASFDFLRHRLTLATSDGRSREIALYSRTVADFYREYRAALAALGAPVTLWPVPCEVERPIRFTEDHEHARYDPEHAQRFWRVLVQADRVLKRFRGRFRGKSSPVHFFWGSFDLATTRFSGRPAPPRPGADAITREAYSHEVISAGFWPGGGLVPEACFYAYAAPAPARLEEARIQPAAARYDRALSEFLLPYEAIRNESSPAEELLAFLQSTYEVAADLAHWDRASLDRPRAEWGDAKWGIEG
jgi:hypothetical protein